MLKGLDLFEPRYRIQQLNSHRSQDGTVMKEKEVAATTRVLDCILYKLHYGVAFKIRQGSETKIPLIVLDSNMPNKAVQLESQTEYVMFIRTVAYDERAVRLVGQNPLRDLAAQRTPVPTVIFNFLYTGREVFQSVVHVVLIVIIVEWHQTTTRLVLERLLLDVARNRRKGAPLVPRRGPRFGNIAPCVFSTSMSTLLRVPRVEQSSKGPLQRPTVALAVRGLLPFPAVSASQRTVQRDAVHRRPDFLQGHMNGLLVARTVRTSFQITRHAEPFGLAGVDVVGTGSGVTSLEQRGETPEGVVTGCDFPSTASRDLTVGETGVVPPRVLVRVVAATAVSRGGTFDDHPVEEYEGVLKFVAHEGW